MGDRKREDASRERKDRRGGGRAAAAAAPAVLQEEDDVLEKFEAAHPPILPFKLEDGRVEMRSSAVGEPTIPTHREISQRCRYCSGDLKRAAGTVAGSRKYQHVTLFVTD